MGPSMWSNFMQMISFNLPNKTEVGHIMRLIFQRRERRLKLQTSLRSHSELEVVSFFIMLSVHLSVGG